MPSFLFPNQLQPLKYIRQDRQAQVVRDSFLPPWGLVQLIKILGELRLFQYLWEKFVIFGKQTITGTVFQGNGGMLLSSPGVSPAYMGVGYIIGPKLGALNFSGGLLAWGLMAPMIMYFLMPECRSA